MIISFICILALRNHSGNDSLFLFVYVSLICISTDIGGYIFGKIFKGPKLTKLSPNKTYSGAFGGFILSILVIILLYEYSYLLDSKFREMYFVNIFYTILISLISQIGDIIISYFKFSGEWKSALTQQFLLIIIGSKLLSHISFQFLFSNILDE